MSLIWLTSFMEVKGGGGLSWEDDLRKVSSDWNRATTFLQHPNGSRLNFQKNSHFFQTNSSFSCNDLLIDQMYTYNHDSNSLIQYLLNIASLISPKLLYFWNCHYWWHNNTKPIFFLRKHFPRVWPAKLLEQVISTLSGKFSLRRTEVWTQSVNFTAMTWQKYKFYDKSFSMFKFQLSRFFLINKRRQ